MKIKTSVTLSEELLEAIGNIADPSGRSALIEEATWTYLRRRERVEQDRRDRELIDQNADRLNAEARDVLQYQAEM